MKRIEVKNSTVSITERGSVKLAYKDGATSEFVMISQNEFEQVVKDIIAIYFDINVKGIKVVAK